MSGKLTVHATAFRPYCRGTLRGFANIHIPEIHLCICDVAVHRSASGASWAQLPARPVVDDGELRRTELGKIEYAQLLTFDDRATREAFSAAVIRALLEFNPHAFDEAAA